MTKLVVTNESPPQRLGYRAPEVVALTGYSERTIRRMIADGTLDTFRVGRSVFIRPESLARVFGGETDDDG